MPGAAQQRIVNLDGVNYVLSAPMLPNGQRGSPFVTRRFLMDLHADAQPTSGRPDDANLLGHREEAIRAPLAPGLQRGLDPIRAGVRRCQDMENICAAFPDLTCLGPLRQATTITGAPATFKLITGQRFVAGPLGFVWLLGSATGTDEPLWYLATSGATTLTNATLQADVAALSAAGVVEISGTAYCVFQAVVVSGGNRRWTAKSTDGTTWSLDYTAASNEETGDGTSLTLTFFGLESISNLLYGLLYNATTGYVGVHSRATGNNAWTLKVRTFASSKPRGFVKWHDSAGADDLFFATEEGLYWYDVSATTVQKVWSFRVPLSSYTGFLCLGVNGNRDGIYFTDGPNVGFFTWQGTAIPTVEYIFPPDDPAFVWHGLPAAKTGDVTALAFSHARPWLYIAFSGDAASTNACIIRYDTKRQSLVDIFYKNSTAQNAIMGMWETGSNLHMMEETAAGGTQSPQFFASITLNPELVNGYKFASTGQIDLSWFDGIAPLHQKGFYQLRGAANNLTTTEKATVSFASDGGGLGAAVAATAGTIVGWWCDQTASNVGLDAREIYARVKLDRGATNTLTPIIRNLAWAYNIPALSYTTAGSGAQSVLRPMTYYEFTVDCAATAGTGQRNLKSSLDVLASLLTTMGKRPLVALKYGPTTNGVNTLVRVISRMTRYTPAMEIHERPGIYSPLLGTSTEPETLEMQVLCVEVGLVGGT